MLTTIQEPSPPSTLEECFKVVQNLTSEMSLSKAVAALQSSTVRASLSIPNEIWYELEPQLKERITTIRNEIRKKKAQQANKKPEKPPDSSTIPSQYPSVTAAQVNAMLAKLHIGSDNEMSSSEGSTDDEILHNVMHTQVIREVHEQDLEVRAHLEHVINYSGSAQAYAILDRGRICVLLAPMPRLYPI